MILKSASRLIQSQKIPSTLFFLLTLLLAPGVAFAVGPPPTTAANHDVIIVGAGAAGLYAAFELNNLGFDVLVLEATNRHGGRVESRIQGTA
jgi:NADPH-dependent 2,4-dienoyl-CoA reductase/sulfur reductase-like enzyme